MTHIFTSDSIRISYDEFGSGVPVVLLHEFAGDARSWRPQVPDFARRYRVIAPYARGYPPSDVPADVSYYTQQRASDDIRELLDGIGAADAHIVGFSMGGYAALHLALQHPDRVRSLTLVSCGYGSDPGDREQFQREVEETAGRMEREGMRSVATWYSRGPTRIQFELKDPAGYREFASQLGEHSDRGSANTFRGIQRERPSVYALKESIAAFSKPVMVVVGDEDEPCLEPGLFMKETFPAAGLLVLPKSGHNLPQEEPGLFNQHILDFLGQVDAGRWTKRDPRTLGKSAILPDDR